jgi:hypothetical protein
MRCLVFDGGSCDHGRVEHVWCLFSGRSSYLLLFSLPQVVQTIVAPPT